MKKIATWAGKKQFEYSGSIRAGTEIFYGQGCRIKIVAKQYDSLLKTFYEKTVDIGTSRDNAPVGSLGVWLQKNITKTAIASTVKILNKNKGCVPIFDLILNVDYYSYKYPH